MRRAILAPVVFALVVMTASCSLAPAGYTPPTSPSSPSETLMRPPSSASVRAGSMQTLVPSLAGRAFTWSVNGIAGGNAAMGTIDANGNYVAPAKWFGVASTGLPTIFPNLTNLTAPTLSFLV